MDINRRKFIQNTSLSLLSSLVPFQASAEIIKLPPPLSLDERLRKAARFRKQGKTNKAIQQFKKIVKDFPSEIRAYDGLRKSLLQKKYKELQVLRLYENGFRDNPDHKDFKDRLAKEYMRIVLGNKKFTQQHNASGNLLRKAKNFYKQLKEQYPERKDYNELYKKSKRKIQQNADSVDARENVEIQTYKKEQRKKFKRRFNQKTEAEIVENLNQLLVKPQSEYRNKHIKELYRILIVRNRKAKNWQQAFHYAIELYNFDKSDPTSLNKIKRLSYKTQNYDELVNVCIENHNLKNTFWSELGLFDAYLKRYNKTGIGNLNQLNDILTRLKGKINQPQERIETCEREIRMAYKQQNMPKALESLNELGILLSGTENTHLAIRYSVLVARYFTKQQNFNNGIQAIQIALGQSENIETTDDLLMLVVDVNQGISIEKEAHRDRLNQVLERLYNRQNL